jgi:lin0833 protein
MKNDEIKNDSQKNLNDKENIMEAQQNHYEANKIFLKQLELTSDDQNETLLISRFEDKYIITLGNESIDIFNDDIEINKKIRELTDNKKLQSEILEKIDEFLNNRTSMYINGVEDTEKNDEFNNFGIHPYDPDQIKYIVKPFPVGTLQDYITGFDGTEDPTIDMNPDFQRNFVWSNKAKSLLIESLLLNIPIPSIYLNQTKLNFYLPADGLQRLNAINVFLSGELKLTGLEYLVQFNGYKYKPKNSQDKSPILPMDIKRRIRDYTINCNIIDSSTPDEVKLDIFRRLNSSGVKLNPQELRNSITTEAIRNLYKVMEKNEVFESTIMNSVNTNRFIHHEFILRFIGFYLWQVKEIPNLTYKGNMKQFLDSVLIYLKFNSCKEELDEIISCFQSTLNNAYKLFGEDAFKKPSYSERKGTINTILFSQILINLIDINISPDSEIGFLKENFDRYMENNIEFWIMISSATNNIRNIKIASDYIKEFLVEEGIK